MTSKQLINQLCYEYNTKNYNEERLKTTQEIKKDLEVLEIIKKKEVVIGLLKGILHSDLQTHSSSYYNSHFVASYRHLTQGEFDLLKGWLENGKTN